MAAHQSQSISSYRSLFDAFSDRATRYPDLPALVGEGGQGRSYSYREVVDLASALASRLRQRDLIDHNGVALLSENRPEWPIAYLAILAAGGTVVPIDANLTDSEINYVIDHSGVRSIFCSAKFADRVSEARPQLSCFALDEMADQVSEAKGNAPYEGSKGSNEVAVVIYTSGTTGDPKAVELTHVNLLANLEGLIAAIDLRTNDCFLSVLPLHHTFGATVGCLFPMMSGARIVYARSLKSSVLLQDLAENRVTVICGVPLLYEKMASAFHRKIALAPIHRRLLVRALLAVSRFGWIFGLRWGKSLLRGLRRKAGIDSVRIMASGGAPLPPPIGRFFNILGIAFLQGYGLTETSPVVSFNRLDDIRCDSVGPPLNNVELRIDKADENGNGEILIRGGNVTPGYRGNQEQTDKLVRDGWLYSGDLGRIKDGHLYVTGRAKNLIVSAAGKNIYPEELEEHLCASDLILEAVVYGRPKANRQGEEVCALIVPDFEAMDELAGVPADAPLSQIEAVIGELVKSVNDRMAAYKRITRHSVQLEELEKTSTRKIKRHKYQ